jgi:serine/threonine protein kinase
LGIVLYELAHRCINGHYCYPFKEYNFTAEFQVLVAVAEKGRRPTISEKCPKLFADLIQDSWDQDPFKRPTCKQILQRLDEIQKDFSENRTQWEQNQFDKVEEQDS